MPDARTRCQNQMPEPDARTRCQNQILEPDTMGWYSIAVTIIVFILISGVN